VNIFFSICVNHKRYTHCRADLQSTFAAAGSQQNTVPESG
jgi:hypothetical protein